LKEDERFEFLDQLVFHNDNDFDGSERLHVLEASQDAAVDSSISRTNQSFHLGLCKRGTIADFSQVDYWRVAVSTMVLIS
jgi:hypothetical protein